MDVAMMAGHEAIVRLFMSHSGDILTSSRTTARPAPAAKHSRPEREPKTTGFDATIVDFYSHEHQSTDTTSGDAHQVQNVLANRTKGEFYPESDLRWIHLPANCTLLTTLRSVENDDQKCSDILKDELWIRQLHDPLIHLFMGDLPSRYVERSPTNLF
ncbi:hypothetical protein BDP81DRAFT_454510 [Colletotrichum phormii]|uniref:Uncharacterized protein n=1 Tax=Colletotrichum phormii TaxID=359342 RepID=A0AAJ0EA05_9PEZI|nr:uncharacterized protein BDP81DRAFT_454510 [Colletotrichum phormii]KAK1623400.1 hypothetical protein BDP81DRAFT_454510 [Colletotrichum phormii]